MNFQLSEEQIAVRDAARHFAQTELLPGVIERDDKQIFPAEQIKKLGELGFLGMMVDPKYGGSGMDAVFLGFFQKLRRKCRLGQRLTAGQSQTAAGGIIIFLVLQEIGRAHV